MKSLQLYVLGNLTAKLRPLQEALQSFEDIGTEVTLRAKLIDEEQRQQQHLG
jgi:hypothetical protein